MSTLRRLSSLLLLLLLATLPAIAEKVATLPAPTGYIDDYAAVLTDPEQRELEHFCRDLHQKTKAQVFVVTVKSLEGESVDDFTHELFGKWKIGEKKTDRGVLILFAIDDHKRRIEVGDGLQGVLTDARAGDIGRSMVPALKASHYEDAIRIGLNGVSAFIAEDSKITLDTLATSPTPDTEQASAPPPPPEATSSAHMPMAVAFILFLSGFGALAVFIFFVVRSFRHRSTTTTSGSGGTAFSSGSSDSSDSSSSSDSFSGGDGGSSDGGGASGDW